MEKPRREREGKGEEEREGAGTRKKGLRGQKEVEAKEERV